MSREEAIGVRCFLMAGRDGGINEFAFDDRQ